MSGWVIVVYSLAVARLTGLVTADVVTEPARDAFVRRLGRPVLVRHELAAADNADVIDWLRIDRHHTRWTAAKLVTCAWCSSIYIGLAVAALAWWHGTNPWLAIPALGLAFSFVAGALSDVGRS